MSQPSPEEQRAHARAMQIVREQVWTNRYIAVFAICILVTLWLLIAEVYVAAHTPQPVFVTNQALRAPYPAPQVQP